MSRPVALPGLPVSIDFGIVTQEGWRELGEQAKGIIEEKGGEGSGHEGHAGIPGHQGGSLPGKGSGRPLTDMQKGLKAYEENPDFYNATTETLAIFNYSNKPAYEFKGEADRVTIPTDLLWLFKYSTATHNHPDHRSFSSSDIKFAADNGLNEIRAVTPKGTYIMRQPNSGWPGVSTQWAREAVTKKFKDVAFSSDYADQNAFFTDEMWKMWSSANGVTYIYEARE
jgi:hypothetical protein